MSTYQLEHQLLAREHRVRPGGSHTKTSITIHSTGNPASTAQNERDWLDNPANTRDASWHYVVEAGKVIQAIPDGEAAWHCGVTDGNRSSLSIEIVESSDRREVLKTAAAFAAEKLKEHRLEVSALRTHWDWSRKNCPRILLNPVYQKEGLDWDWFVKRVQALLQEECEMRYQVLADVPEWGKTTVQKLIAKGVFADANALDLSEDMVRMLVFHDRCGIYQ